MSRTRQSLLNGLNDPGGHLRGGVPVVDADRAPAEVAVAAGLVAWWPILYASGANPRLLTHK